MSAGLQRPIRELALPDFTASAPSDSHLRQTHYWEAPDGETERWMWEASEQLWHLTTRVARWQREALIAHARARMTVPNAHDMERARELAAEIPGLAPVCGDS
jgi:hypothetical protein